MLYPLHRFFPRRLRNVGGCENPWDAKWTLPGHQYAVVVFASLHLRARHLHEGSESIDGFHDAPVANGKF